MENRIIEQCGNQDGSIELIDPGNDPNFIFENDPNYDVVVLYDENGMVVNTNSWVECAHYVNGGWSNSRITEVPGDQYIVFGISIVIISYLLLRTFYKVYVK